MAQRQSKREKKKLIYLPDGVVVDEYKWTKMLETKNAKITPFTPLELKGYELTYEYLQENEFNHPILVMDPEGLEMVIPSVTVPEVAELVGRDRIVDVLEVSTQTDRQMTLAEWAEYFVLPPEQRDRILNVISLEIGESKLGKMTTRPKIVRELDWIDNVWPRDILIHEYPRVQLYCLMGVKDSYTDFHIDFGGTSVFYHIISGSKTFYFIEPTIRNLDIYSTWSTSPGQGNTFLGDLIPDCRKITLLAGNTLFIPSGWIHAVFTPQDTVVIGGNYLHCFAIESQLKIAQMEKDTNVPMRFRFPYFANMQWYAAKKYLNNLKDISLSFSDRELASLQYLVDHLSKLANRSTDFQRLTKAERKTIRSEIPVGIKNVSLLLQTLQLALAFRRNGKRLVDDGDGWDSSVTEMEFVDSDEELEDFLPPDVAPLTDEELFSSEDDDRGFESSDDDSDKAKKLNKRKIHAIKSAKIENKKMKIPIPKLKTFESKNHIPTANDDVKKIVVEHETALKPRPNQASPLLGSVSDANAVPQTKPAVQISNPKPMLNGKPLVLPKSSVLVPNATNAAVAKKKNGVFNRLMKKMKKK